MALDHWPATVPYRVLRDGYTIKPLRTPDVTEFEDGPDRMRQSSIIDARVETVGIVMNAAEVQLATQFIVGRQPGSLYGGSKRFLMPVRFIGETDFSDRQCYILKGEYSFRTFGRNYRLDFTRVVIV